MSLKYNASKNILGLTLQDVRQQQYQTLFGKRRYWWHIVIWVIIGWIIFANKDIQQIIFSNFQLDKFEKISSPFSVYASLTLSFIICGVLNYILVLRIVPYVKWKMRKNYLWLVLIVYFVTFIFLFIAIILLLQSDTNSVINTAFAFFIVSLSIAFIMLLYFPSLYYFLDIYEKQKTLKDYKKILEARIQAEKQFLSSQINPHFLFNTLNNIYALIINNQPEAKIVLNKLEGLISYINNECQNEWIDLSSEVEFIKNYLSLEQLRFKENKVSIVFEIDGDISQSRISPLILVAFIENAFKHGVSKSDQYSYVRIRLDAMDNYLQFSIINNKPNVATNVLSDKIGGVGLRNVKRRLTMNYPNRHKLIIKDTKKSYYLMLTLQDTKI